jgi:beta-glucanase (GH16 family)
VAAFGAVLLLAGCSSPAPPWTETWSASFAGPAGQGVSTRTWAYNTGPGTVFGGGETERMTASPANVRLDGHGHLDLIPLRTRGGWTSGRIETTRSFTAPAGGEMKVTATIRQPDPADPNGYWPAFWMLSVNGHEPGLGEIDIMEDVNSGTQTSGTLHCGDLARKNADGTVGPCHEDTGLSDGLQPCPACATEYHTYAVIIDRRRAGHEQIRWYLDGQETFGVSESQVGTAAWTAAVDHGFRIILDVAIGGHYPDAACHCQSPTSRTTSGPMSVASVAVYNLKG